MIEKIIRAGLLSPFSIKAKHSYDCTEAQLANQPIKITPMLAGINKLQIVSVNTAKSER